MSPAINYNAAERIAIEFANSLRTISMTASLPVLSDRGLRPTHPVIASDEYGDSRDIRVAGEFPLTIKVDDKEVVTLMTLGTHPELLALGYLRNQRLIESVQDIKSIEVDWDRETAQVTTHRGEGIVDWERKMAKRTVTTGCGQGTIFSCTLDKIYENPLPPAHLRQSDLYALLTNITSHNEIYRQAGAVHGCALCENTEIRLFVEDVGRHNAADTIAGQMWLDGTSGEGKIFYTTGRLTSEIVMKVAHMGIPVLLSRSGITFMGLELAQDLRVTMIARAKGRHFLVYNGVDTIEYDDIPPRRRTSAPQSIALN